MPTVLGTQLGTRLGTELADMVDPGSVPTFDATKLYALSDFTGADLFATQVGGGEAGTASGFGAAMLIRIPALGATSRYLFNRGNGSNAGWLPWIDSSNRIQFLCASGTPANVASPQYQLVASDAGRVMMFVVQHDGAKIRLFVNRAQAADGTAIAGYTPLAHRTTLSGSPTNSATAPAVGTQQSAWFTFQGTPTQVQILALFDAARIASGDLPTKAAAEAVMPGTTVTHRWSLRDVLLAANVPVADGSAAPATIPDSVTGATVDEMAKTGSPVIRVIDPATPKLWSFETTPILYGAAGYTLTDYFEGLVNAMPGDPAGFTTSVLCAFQTLGAGRRLFAQRDTAGGGWEYQANASQVFFACSNGTTAATSPGSTVTADIGKLLLFTGVWDDVAKSVRLYAKRVQVSTGSPLAAGYLPNTAIKPMIGRANSGAPTPGTTIYGVYYAPGTPSLAQVQAQFDAVQANESIQAVPGLAPGILIDLKQDVAGGTVPATLTDRGAGGSNFTRIGSPTASPQYSRAFGW